MASVATSDDRASGANCLDVPGGVRYADNFSCCHYALAPVRACLLRARLYVPLVTVDSISLLPR